MLFYTPLFIVLLHNTYWNSGIVLVGGVVDYGEQEFYIEPDGVVTLLLQVLILLRISVVVVDSLFT